LPRIDLVLLGIHLTSAYPLWRCWQVNRSTSLIYVVLWTAFAWLGWGGALLNHAVSEGEPSRILTYLALCLSSCAGIAVLGARRPGEGAWNFVVVGLLGVLLLPLAQSFGVLNLSTAWLSFLIITLSVIGINYCLTSFGPAAFLFLMGCGCTLWNRFTWMDRERPADILLWEIGLSLIVISPWLAFLTMRLRSKTQAEFDRLWLDFRDRYGMFLALRIQDQFNRSAKNADWPVHLDWKGLSKHNDYDSSQALATLQALLKRFGLIA
jgi:hypothetical protein